MAVTVQSLLQERKYPFIFTLSLLFLCVLLVLISSSQYPHFFSFSSNLAVINQTLTLAQPPLVPLISEDTVSPPLIADRTEKQDQDDGVPSTGIAPPMVDSSPELHSVPAISDSQKENQEEQGRGFGGDDDFGQLKWEVCKGKGAVDYIPCLDNWKAIKALKSRKHMEHRERHCPRPSPRCLVPLPKGYKVPILWPKSRDMIWYDNVPHPKLVDYKKDQHWVVKSGDHFIFPGGGTQFKEGVTNYIKSIERTLPVIKWGKNMRVILDVGCGVASFGGALLDRDVITVSFAPKDEHEAQIQFALERGIPATLSVIGTQKLTFPDNAFDLIHCARCRVHWDADGGKPLMELNRVLRPGGFFIWSATPVYQYDERDVNVWKSMVTLTKAICWKTVIKAMASRHIGLVIYQKPISSSCYEEHKQNDLPMCDGTKNISWYTPLERCLPRLPASASNWPPPWPKRLTAKPVSLSSSEQFEMFNSDTKHWFTLVSDVYLDGLGINWSTIRNVMDMNAGHGGFATALISMPPWVMNVVPIHEPDTLPVIFDRGLIGVYHDWCESFNTYPRTYDLLHSSFLFSNLPKRCEIIDLAVEIDRIVRPQRWVLIHDTKSMINKLASIFRSLHWTVNIYRDEYLVGEKSFWRPRNGEAKR